MKSPSAFFESVRLMKLCRFAAEPLPTCASSVRSTSELKITRPAVVSTSSPFQRYSIGCWSVICFDSTANATSSSFWNRFGRGSSFSALSGGQVELASR